MEYILARYIFLKRTWKCADDRDISSTCKGGGGGITIVLILCQDLHNGKKIKFRSKKPSPWGK